MEFNIRKGLKSKAFWLTTILGISVSLVLQQKFGNSIWTITSSINALVLLHLSEDLSFKKSINESSTDASNKNHHSNKSIFGKKWEDLPSWARKLLWIFYFMI